MISSLLSWAVLTVSFFNTISLLWLGLMVLLAGNRRSAGTWLTGGGLLLGALFFTSHTAILGRGLASTSFGMDFWWGVSWTPAFVAPLAWYGAMLWYSGYRFNRPHRHHSWVILVTVLAACIALLLIFANPLPSYQYVAGRILVLTPSVAGIPLLIIVYVIFSLLCYLLPLDLLRKAEEGLPLEARARQRARPYLVAASVSLLLAGGLLAWTAFWALSARPVPTLSNPQTEQTVQQFDLAVDTLVAIAITLLGRAIVGFEVFTGRPLPRNRFFRMWRSTVILAVGFGAAAAWTLAIDLRPIYSLMLATGLMTLFYALYSWRSFAERDDFMQRLRPFVANQDLYGQIIAPEAGTGDSTSDGNTSRQLFETLCREVLEVRQSILTPVGTLATLAGPPMIYPDGNSAELTHLAGWAAGVAEQFAQEMRNSADASCLSTGQAGAAAGIDWAVPLWSSRGLDGILFLGEKKNQNPFTEEEIEIAQASGERLLDLLAGTEMARLFVNLLRQRLAQTRILEGQGRRRLHDEILPELHTILLNLSSQTGKSPEVRQAVEELSTVHRQIADLMREMPLPTPQRLVQEGLATALRGLVENDFRNDFARVEWQIQPEAVQYARQQPLFINEVLFFATRELIRNAAIHGRGGNPETNLCLKIKLEMMNGFHLTVEDNGSGFHPEEQGAKSIRARGGSGVINNGGATSSGGNNGLRIHSAMLAAIGARLDISPLSTGGTRAEIVKRD